jgi:plastocyanin
MRTEITVLKKFTPVAAALFVLTVAPVVFAQQSTKITVIDNSFSPKETRIAAGGTVSWMNTGSMVHTVTFEDGNFDSGNLNPGLSTSHTFTTPGTYRYYCRYHGAPGGSGMSGTIIVTSATSTASNAATSSARATSTQTQYRYAYTPQQPMQYPQVPNTGGQPVVRLNNVPYTGYDLGPRGDAIYALLMGIFILSFGYLIFYFVHGFYFFQRSCSDH